MSNTELERKVYCPMDIEYEEIHLTTFHNQTFIMEDNTYNAVYGSGTGSDIITFFNDNSHNFVLENSDPTEFTRGEFNGNVVWFVSDESQNVIHCDGNTATFFLTENSENIAVSGDNSDIFAFATNSSENTAYLGGGDDIVGFVGGEASELEVYLGHGEKTIIYDNTNDLTSTLTINFSDVFQDGDIAKIELGLDAEKNPLYMDENYSPLAEAGDVEANLQGLNLNLTALLEANFGEGDNNAEFRMSENDLQVNLSNTSDSNWVTVADFSGIEGAPLTNDELQLVNDYFSNSEHIIA